MKTLAIISEFNPFHNGHKYLLDKSKKITNADICLSIMSGDAVQRGELAILDKFKRANEAINQGFDIVIEMPSFITLQSAWYFALGNIKILNKLNINYLCFGIEELDSDDFIKFSDILIKRKIDVDNETLKLSKEGISYPKARAYSIKKIIGFNKLSSNNYLALEYILALNYTNSKIKPIPITRKGSKNSDDFLRNTNLSSSGAIRNYIMNSKKIYNIKSNVPEITYKDLKNEHYIEYQNKLFDFLKYKLFIEKNIKNDYLGLENGLINHIKKCAKNETYFENFINKATTKSYTSSRIKRAIFNIILENTSDMNDIDISFLKILSFNSNSLKFLREIKNKITIIQKKKDLGDLDSKNKLVYKKNLDTSNLYSILKKRDIDIDYSRKIKIAK
ncbi:MAG: nucleotidyltransferase family protein [Peptoniphilaceae bacterium]|nr:nucleotidyltransferase family protein [Peptoniphilaceae bacterium]MDD7382858.1 nucleotidyltransferase family protein [Peptoniphilaceae bacterium]MDY3738183.1 nucleotidyltransferase family protein [Peptoniphilaceae bacterium]